MQKKAKEKFLISHSHSDKTIVDGFVKEILKVGCGFKDSDLFCTLDTSTIRTGDDFREKIIENMRDCDFIFFLFLKTIIRVMFVKMKWELPGLWKTRGFYLLLFPK